MRSYRIEVIRRQPLIVISVLFCIASLGACARSADTPRSSTNPETPGQTATAGEQPAARPAVTQHEDDMSTADTALNRINDILKQSPATEKICGEKHSVISRDGAKIALESSWSKCPGRDRIAVDIEKLDLERIWAELVVRYGQARIYVPCRDDAPCTSSYSMGEDETEWQHLRDEPAFTVDCAPDATVMETLKNAVQDWLRAASAPAQ